MKGRVGYAWKWLICTVALALFGCASWRTCVVGKMPATQQAVAVEVAAALATENYAAVLDDLVTEYGEPAVTCTVQAIVDHEKAKAAAAPVAKARVLASVSQTHGESWLSAHRKTACAEMRRTL